MSMYRSRFATLLFGTILAVAALPTGGHAAGSPGVRVVAATPMAAVRATVAGFYRPGYSYFTCSTQLPAHRIPAWSTCPFTSRFLKHIQQSNGGHRGVELCPQQYPPRTVTLHLLSGTTTSARINARWDLGKLAYTSTFVVVRRNGSWLVDNEYLAGKPANDIYRQGSTPGCRFK